MLVVRWFVGSFVRWFLLFRFRETLGAKSHVCVCRGRPVLPATLVWAAELLQRARGVFVAFESCVVESCVVWMGRDKETKRKRLGEVAHSCRGLRSPLCGCESRDLKPKCRCVNEAVVERARIESISLICSDVPIRMIPRAGEIRMMMMMMMMTFSSWSMPWFMVDAMAVLMPFYYHVSRKINHACHPRMSKQLIQLLALPDHRGCLLACFCGSFRHQKINRYRISRPSHLDQLLRTVGILIVIK